MKQPEWKELSSLAEAKEFARKVSYPVLVRPSYVLSGAAMNVARDEKQLKDYLTMASDVAPDHPVVITKFVTGAREIELDAVANKGNMVNWAISEHIENAGVHSGDATMILPSDQTKNILVSGNTTEDFVATAQNFVKGGYGLYATGDAVELLKKHNVKFTALDTPDLESTNENNALTWVTKKKIDLVVNFPRVHEDETNYVLRRKSVDYGVPCLTNEQVVHFLSEALIRVKDFPIKNYNDYLETHND